MQLHILYVLSVMFMRSGQYYVTLRNPYKITSSVDVNSQQFCRNIQLKVTKRMIYIMKTTMRINTINILSVLFLHKKIKCITNIALKIKKYIINIIKCHLWQT